MLAETSLKLYCAIRGITPLQAVVRRLRRFPVFRHVYGKALATLLSAQDEREWTQTKYGWLKLAPVWESDSATVGEPDLTPRFAALLRPGKVLYDIGAHIGFYMVLGARGVTPSGTVYAFEPDPENVAILKEVIGRNSLTNTTVIEAAVSDMPGRFQFERAPGLRHSGHLAGVGCDGGDVGDHILVTSTTVDLFCQDHPAPHIIKIDVEGAEANVLRGALSSLEQHRPILAVEIHRSEFVDEVRGIVEPFGYSFQRLPPHDGRAFPCHYICECD